MKIDRHHDKEVCRKSVNAVQDTLYVLNGKWKIPIIVVLSDGPMRFKELQRQLGEITPKVLSKELKELELNEFLTRTVYPTTPVTVEYALTPYSESLTAIISAMRDWGLQHKERIRESYRSEKIVEVTEA